MPEIDLVGAAAEAVERDEHWLGVVGADVGEFIFRVVSRAWREGVVGFRGSGICYKVYGEGTGEVGICGVEDAAFVDDWRSGGFYHCPCCLEMAVEE